jgi:hypothetical protein
MNYKRKKPRTQVRCEHCTSNRNGNNKGGRTQYSPAHGGARYYRAAPAVRNRVGEDEVS